MGKKLTDLNRDVLMLILLLLEERDLLVMGLVNKFFYELSKKAYINNEKIFDETFFKKEQISLDKTLNEGEVGHIGRHLFRAIKGKKTKTVNHIFSQIKPEKKDKLADTKCENVYEEGQIIRHATPLYVAAKHGFEDIVEILITNKAWGEVTPHIPNPLRIAVKNQHSTVVIKMYENYFQQFSKDVMSFIECREHYSNITNLFLAAKNGDAETAKFLIEKGHEIDVLSIYGALVIGVNDAINITPLYIASMMGHIEVVKLLLKGRTVLIDIYHETQKSNVNFKCIENGRTPLFEAARKGHVEVVSALLQAGAEINCKDIYGVTPLCVAARNGHLDVVKILLKNGADIALRTNRGFTPLNAANEFGHTEVAKEIHKQELINYLQRIKKDPNKKNQYDAGTAFLQFFDGTSIPEKHKEALLRGDLRKYVRNIPL